MRRWRALSPGTRTFVIVVAVIVGVNLLVAGASELTPEPSGPRSSSFATTRGGLAAYADLLSANGHEVTRARTRLDKRTLRAGETVVVLDPATLSDAESHALGRFARRGGRVVIGGSGVTDHVRNLVLLAPRRRVEGVVAPGVLAPAPEAPPGIRVITAGEGAWPRAGASLPVLGAPGRYVLTVADLGKGRVLMLADASPLQNRLLDRADNAAFGLALAGPAGRRVVFAERAHGYKEASGLAALPSRWKTALLVLLAAGLVAIAARWRRLGPVTPPDPVTEQPSRRVYMDALAGALARTRDPGAVAERVQAAARRELARRSGIRVDAPPATVEAAARAAGLTDAEVASLTMPVADERGLVEAAGALARLRGRVPR